jgi:hypothetical protein
MKKFVCLAFVALYATIAEGQERRTFRAQAANQNQEVIGMMPNGYLLLMRQYELNTRSENPKPFLYLDGALMSIDIPAPPDAAGSFHRINVVGIASDGTIAGRLSGRSDLPFVWNWRKNTGHTYLPVRDNEDTAEVAAISGDGKTVGGYVCAKDYDRTPCIWRLEGQNWRLILLPKGMQRSAAFITALSPNGRYAAGKIPTVIRDVNYKACVWNIDADHLMIVDSEDEAIANGVNDDGLVALTVKGHAAAWSAPLRAMMFEEKAEPSKGLCIDAKGRVGGMFGYGKQRACVWTLEGVRTELLKEPSAVLCMGDGIVGGYRTPTDEIAQSGMMIKID